jgi:polysaccharide pyruvyl transferase WcaK-like protein
MGSDPRLIEQPISGFACLINWLSWCDCVVAARYHCIVLPCALNIPVIGLAYHQKTFDLMESMGQSAYCLDIDSFRATELIDLFHTLQRNRQAISTELRERAIECRARLAEQFDRVLGGAIEPEHPRAPLEPAPRAGGRTSWT